MHIFIWQVQCFLQLKLQKCLEPINYYCTFKDRSRIQWNYHDQKHLSVSQLFNFLECPQRRSFLHLISAIQSKFERKNVDDEHITITIIIITQQQVGADEIVHDA